MQKTWLEMGRETLDAEAEAISSVCGSLDHRFGEAMDLLAHCRGRIVVFGLGKSGHVGRKLAATLASTGTPAFFVHAAEAYHGDFGMITNGDIVLAISNSGETREVTEAVTYIRRIGASVVALTGNLRSTLACRSDAVFYCPVQREADPLNLAPTNSATAALALGDAIAIALMTARGFQAMDFALFHPGGNLGAGLSDYQTGGE